MIALPTAADVVKESLRGRRLRTGEILFQAALGSALLISLGILAVLLGNILVRASGVLVSRGWDFVASPLSLDAASAGVRQGVVGSVILAVIVAVVAFPIGIGCAIYLEEYASDGRWTRVLTTNIRNLAGVPSIVYGILGFAVFVRFVAAVGLGGSVAGGNLIAAGLTLAALVLPITIITASEALRAVSDELRRASFAVGATQWETIRHHVLPAAAPGILTGTVLTLARAFGESAPLLLVGAATGFFTLGRGAGVGDILTETYAALPVTVFSWSRQPGDDFRALTAAAIIVLLVVMLVANAAAIIMRNRFERDTERF